MMYKRPKQVWEWIRARPAISTSMPYPQVLMMLDWTVFKPGSSLEERFYGLPRSTLGVEEVVMAWDSHHIDITGMYRIPAQIADGSSDDAYNLLTTVRDNTEGAMVIVFRSGLYSSRQPNRNFMRLKKLDNYIWFDNEADAINASLIIGDL